MRVLSIGPEIFLPLIVELEIVTGEPFATIHPKNSELPAILRRTEEAVLLRLNRTSTGSSPPSRVSIAPEISKFPDTLITNFAPLFPVSVIRDPSAATKLDTLPR